MKTAIASLVLLAALIAPVAASAATCKGISNACKGASSNNSGAKYAPAPYQVSGQSVIYQQPSYAPATTHYAAPQSYQAYPVQQYYYPSSYTSYRYQPYSYYETYQEHYWESWHQDDYSYDYDDECGPYMRCF